MDGKTEILEKGGSVRTLNTLNNYVTNNFVNHGVFSSYFLFEVLCLLGMHHEETNRPRLILFLK